jgi:hypothetical protein
MWVLNQEVDLALDKLSVAPLERAKIGSICRLDKQLV